MADKAGTLSPGDVAEQVPVVIVGGGPVGLSLALGLAHHGVRSVVIEHDFVTERGSRAFGIWGRTLEIFEDWGVVRPFLDGGDQRMAVAPVDCRTERPAFAVDFSLLADESSMPGIVLLPQATTELTLRDAIAREPLAAVVAGDCVGVDHDADGVTAIVEADGATWRLRGQYLVGADGSRSVVRESLGMRHVGTILTVNLLVFDVELEDSGLQPIRIDPARHGLLAALRFAPGHWRVLMSIDAGKAPKQQALDGPPPRKPDVPVADLAPYVHRLFGQRAHRVTWQSQTTLYQQRIPHFRVGRIVFAGDSAHLISPAGGQGMNQGIQDAENLAWTLAAVVNGADADRMLDGYDGERRHAAEVVSRRAFVNSQLEFRTPPALRPLGFAGMRVLTRMRPVVRRIVRRLSMRDLRYRGRHSARLLGGHRAVGRRFPDVVLASGQRLSERLLGGVGVVSIGTTLHVGVPDAVAAVTLERSPEGLGLRRGSVVIVRPDRHVGAVLRRPTERELAQALSDACGVRVSSSA